MKTIIKYFTVAVLVGVLFAACSKEQLDTNPTDRVSGTTIFSSEHGAKTAINGAYSLFWRYSYVSGNTAQAYGHESTLLAEDLMADDMVQMAFNWFGWDYNLDYTSRINIGTASRSYNVWNMNYTLISNVNYIIAEEANATTTGYKNILAQAYALRAFCYFELIQMYQKTYIGNESAPGVPVYTLPVNAGDEGKSRGTVENVYTQINSDITRAVALFEEINKPRQEHTSHIDYYVAKGFQARIALVQGNNDLAASAAAEAMSRLGDPVLAIGDITKGFSDRNLSSNLWAMEMLSEQSQIYGSIYCMLDPTSASAYGYGEPKCISSWLYNKVADSRWDDARKAWWNDGSGAATSGPNTPYVNKKRMAHTQANWVGDIIFMRGEEMLLIRAEALVRSGDYGGARTLLKSLAAKRQRTPAAVTAYNTYVDNLPNGNTLSVAALGNTNTDPQNLLEEVLLQRRIELWAELGRIKDVLRLKQAYNRDYPGSNHTELVVNVNTGAESGAFLFKIPQTEFDGNANILSSEQNPIN